MSRARAALLAICCVSTLGLRPAATAAGGRCVDAVVADRIRRVTLGGSAYDVALHPDGRYVVGTSIGVLVLDPCDLTVEVRCRDADGARRVAVRRDGRVDYLRGDGSPAGCDPSNGRSVAPGSEARRLRSAQRGGTARPLRVEGGRLWVGGNGSSARPLPWLDQVLAAEPSPDGELIAVSDRAGRVSLYSATGVLRTRYRPHRRNAYAVVFDERLRRIVSVGNPGELALRRWPAEP